MLCNSNRFTMLKLCLSGFPCGLYMIRLGIKNDVIILQSREGIDCDFN